MENASKALLIAGGVLLMILLLSLFVYTVNKMGGSTARIYSDLEKSKVDEFNQVFLNYQVKAYKLGKDGKEIGLTMQDVISIVNFAKDNNERHIMPVHVNVSVTGISIKVNGTDEEAGDNWEDKDNETLDKILKKYYYFENGEGTEKLKFKDINIEYGEQSKGEANFVKKIEIIK